MMACPGPENFLDYVGRRLASVERQSFELHLDACNTCRELLAEVGRSMLDELGLDEVRDELADTVPRESASELVPHVAERYRLGELLGRGGMGEVLAAHDGTIDREVAVKRMIGAAGNAPRFVREARVQGQLEHPAIVPVHDLATDAAGQPYFVMKRVVGTTLADRIASTRPERRRLLLGKLVEVCLAIEFAHSRGVVHRDLKPSNIMLGDFGEVYVLDWGVAKIVAERDVTTGDTNPSSPDATVEGAQLGTPGYWAPEQERGEAIDARADVYALGCILFEILSGKRVGRTPVAPSTVTSADVPPELDDLCMRALAKDPKERPTARELADKIQAYLDGDRDLARRRELAAQRVAAARAALAEPGDAGRAVAMREAGRALATDPDNADARDLVGRLLLEAPTQIPAAAAEAADRMRAKARRPTLVYVSLLYFFIGATMAAYALFPGANTPRLLGLAVLEFALGGLCIYFGTRDIPLRTRAYWPMIGLNSLQLAIGCLLLGPLLTMFYVVGSLAGWLSLPTGRPVWITIAAHVVAFLPFPILEALHVLPSTFHIDGGVITLTPPALALTSGLTTLILVVALLTEAVSHLFIILTMRRAQEKAQDRVHSHTWHLEQVLGSSTSP